jgi:hypothetical protein
MFGLSSSVPIAHILCYWQFCFCTKSSASPGFTKQIMPILRILFYNSSLVTSTAVSLTAAKFKPPRFTMSGFVLFKDGISSKYNIRIRFVLHRKHFTSPLQSPTSYCCLGEQSLFIVRTIKNTQTHCAGIIYSNSVRTSQETHYVSATKPNRLMLFRETVAVYCENYTQGKTRVLTVLSYATLLKRLLQNAPLSGFTRCRFFKHDACLLSGYYTQCAVNRKLKKLEQRSHKCVELRGEYVE